MERDKEFLDTIVAATKEGFNQGILAAVQCMHGEFVKKQVFTRTELMEILQDLEMVQKIAIDKFDPTMLLTKNVS